MTQKNIRAPYHLSERNAIDRKRADAKVAVLPAAGIQVLAEDN